MLTAEDKEEIKRLVGEMIAESGPSHSERRKHPDDIEYLDRLQNVAAEIHDLIVNEGFTELTFVNPATGERRVLKGSVGSDHIVDVTARAIEVFGTREKALRWLKTPIRSLGDQTPISLLRSPEGAGRVQDLLGRVEHGIW
jgi:putative toxin-antitoxin system antitoxin component (TIGR02293 family)